jgi:hypothetical protein
VKKEYFIEKLFDLLWLIWFPFAFLLGIPFGFYGEGKVYKIISLITLPIWYPVYLIMGGWQDIWYKEF